MTEKQWVVDRTCSLCPKGAYTMEGMCRNCGAALLVTFTTSHEAIGYDVPCPRCGVQGRVTIGKYVEPMP